MSSKPAEIVLQAGAVPFRRLEDRVEYCLLTSLRTRRWGFPKGMIDPGETAMETALKEAQEEGGLFGTLLVDPLGHYEYAKWGLRLRVEMHLMHVQAQATAYPESAARERRWASLEEARELLDRVSLRRMLDLAAERIAGLQQVDNDRRDG